MALGRSKEIGLRKLLGADRRQLTTYLLLESVAYNICALGMGAGIAYLAFPFVQQLFAVGFLLNFWVLAGRMLIVAIACGIISGLSPLILLTSFKRMEVIRHSKVLSFSRKEGPFNLKRVMVTLQLCIPIILAGSTLI